MTSLLLGGNVRTNEAIVSKKSPGVAQSSPVPPPVFYDKLDNKIGTPEVRMPNVQAINNPSPTIYREQQNCEICHKKNHGEEMLLCDGCDCGKFVNLIRLMKITSIIQDFIRFVSTRPSTQSQRSSGSALHALQVLVVILVSMKAKNTVYQVSKPVIKNSDVCGLRRTHLLMGKFYLKMVIS